MPSLQYVEREDGFASIFVATCAELRNDRRSADLHVADVVRQIDDRVRLMREHRNAFSTALDAFLVRIADSDLQKPARFLAADCLPGLNVRTIFVVRATVPDRQPIAGDWLLSDRREALFFHQAGNQLVWRIGHRGRDQSARSNQGCNRFALVR